MDRLKAMQEPLRELKCENDANVTGYCTMNPADAQFDLFDALGRKSQLRDAGDGTAGHRRRYRRRRSRAGWRPAGPPRPA